MRIAFFLRRSLHRYDTVPTAMSTGRVTFLIDVDLDNGGCGQAGGFQLFDGGLNYLFRDRFFSCDPFRRLHRDVFMQFLPFRNGRYDP